MVFSSILFLCIFLPVTVFLYYILPKRFRNLTLLLVSLIFYSWGEPRYVLIMLFSTVFDYTNGRLLEHFSEKEKVRKGILILSLVVNLGILAFFKYTDFVIENINRLAGSSFGLLSLALPIGISFYTFQTLSYTIDVYRRKVSVQKNIIDFGMYICLFPQLIAGPIVRYADIEKEIQGRRETADQVWHGLVRFAVGLGKKVLLANQIGALWNEISSMGSISAGTAWIGVLAFTFQIYFDFSGYSDMAIGLGEVFGFRFPENFHYPYESRSVTEFWRRWHMTLGSWFREYLYIPLGGNRCGRLRWMFNLFVVWSLTGLWHGADWNFLLWGIYYFVLLAAEKLFLLKAMERWPKVLRHLYALFFILIGWIIFACSDLNQLGSYLASMFGFGQGTDGMTLYYLSTYGALFFLLAIASTEWPKKLLEKLKTRMVEKTSAEGRSQSIRFLLELAFVLAILLVSMIFLVGDSYNPFLYFRF